VFKMIGVPKQYQGTVTARGPLGEQLEQQITKDRTLREVAGLYDLPAEAAAESFSTLAHVADNLRAVKTSNEAVAARVKDMVDSIDATLGDTKIWGETADTVRALQAARTAQTEALAAMKGKLKFNEATGAVDRGSLVSYMKTLTRAEGADADAVDAVRKWITAQQDIQTNTAKLVGDPARLMGEMGGASKLSKLAGKFEVAHQDITDRVVTFNVLERLGKQRTDQLGVGVGPLGYAAQGALQGAIGSVFGPAGFVAATAAHGLGAVASQAALDPARAAVLRANAGANTEKARAAFGNAVGKVLGLPAKALPVEGRAVPALARTTQRLIEAKSDSERREAFQERLAEVAELNTPSAAAARNTRLLSVGSHMPNTAAAIDAKANLASRLLLSAVPASRMTPGGLQPRAPQYSDDAIRRFMRIDRAVQDPAGILERAADGNLSAEDVQVWHELYPELRSAMQAQVTQAMAGGHEMDRQREQTVMKLVTTESAERGSYIQRLQKLHAPIEPQGSKSSSSRSPAQRDRVARALMSPADRLLE
jgi:hypothetical protein